MTRSTMGAAITARDFSDSTTDPLRDRWTPGKMRHVVAAAAGHRALVVIEHLAHVDVELVRVRTSTAGPGGRLVTRYQYGEGEHEADDTGYLLEHIGTVVDLESTTTKWTALETYRNEVSAAIAFVRDEHGDVEGRRFGSWSGELTQYGAVVRYTPATNPYYGEHPDMKGFWKPALSDYAQLIRPTFAEARKAEQVAEIEDLLAPAGRLTGTGSSGTPVTGD